MEISTITGYIDYLTSVRKRTMNVISVIPHDKINWKPKDDAFSFADIIRHIAAMEFHVWAKSASFRQSTYPGHEEELAKGYDEVIKYLTSCHEKSLRIYSELKDDDLTKKCTTPAGAKITLWKWLRAWIEHEIHHRGQIYTYLHLLSVPTPPIFGITSEEVKERSVQSE